MIFIDKVKLHNFQSHKDTEVEFHRGLNVIVGNSDSGKTSILRAIKWVIYNEPSGDYFMREGETEVSVTIWFSTNAVLKRYRTKSKNAYYLKRSNGEEFTFEGFGVRVPQEIIEEIEIDKVALDEKNSAMINIAEQLEGPFLLTEKNSVRASAIGRLVGVNLVDEALRDTIRDNKQILINLKSMYKREAELKEEIEKFDYLEDYEKKLEKLTKIKSKVDILTEKLNKYRELNSRYKKVDEDIELDIKVLEKYSNIEKIDNIYSELDLKIPKFFKYNRYNNIYLKYNKDIENYSEIAEKYINIDDISKKLYDLNEKIYRYNKFFKLNREYADNRKNTKITYLEYKKYENINKLENIIKDIEICCRKFVNLGEYSRNLSETNFRIKKGEQYIALQNRKCSAEKYEGILDDKIKKLHKLMDIRQEYINLNYEFLNKSKEVEYLNCEIDKNIEKYNAMLEEKGYCPLCLSKIDDNRIEHIRDHFKG